MKSYNQYLIEAVKQWLAFKDLPKGDTPALIFFKQMEKIVGKEDDSVYIDPTHDFKSSRMIDIKISNEVLIHKIVSALPEYNFTKSSKGFDSTEIVKVRIMITGGIRGSGVLPRAGETLKTPSTEQGEMGVIEALKMWQNGDPLDMEAINKKVGFKFDLIWQDSIKKTVHAVVNSGRINRGHKIFLDSEKNASNILFATVKRLGMGDTKDNWNPADIWLMSITQAQIKAQTKDFVSVDQFNAWMLKMYRSNQVVGVSLKKIAKNKDASFKDVKVSMDELAQFSFLSVDFTPTLTNFILKTDGDISGFNIRVGYKGATIKSASNIAVYSEGRQKGSNVQLGAVSTQLFKAEAKSERRDVAKFKKQLLKMDDASLLRTLRRLIGTAQKKSGVTIGKYTVPTKRLKLVAACFLTYHLLIYLYATKGFLTKCYYSATKRNSFSSVHLKVY